MVVLPSMPNISFKWFLLVEGTKVLPASLLQELLT